MHCKKMTHNTYHPYNEYFMEMKTRKQKGEMKRMRKIRHGAKQLFNIIQII